MRDLLEGQREALVIFQDVDGYVTPSWYATKREHGRVVPTWNYAAVHVWGPVRVIEDRAWLARQVADLTALKEAGRAEPWA
jgi:transcriptional regulator